MSFKNYVSIKVVNSDYFLFLWLLLFLFLFFSQNTNVDHKFLTGDRMTFVQPSGTPCKTLRNLELNGKIVRTHRDEQIVIFTNE